MSIPPLSLPFVSEEAARAASVLAGDPDWRLAERLDAVGHVASLPAEANQLFTPYLDLRAARFPEVAVDVLPRPMTEGGILPDGAALLVDIEGATSARRVLGTEALAAGVIVGDLAAIVGGDHPRLAAMLQAGGTLPTTDAFAHVPRAASTLDLVIAIPPGKRLEQPIVLRWRAGAPGTGSVGRTFIILGPGARARVLEEQLPDGGGSESGPQRLWWGTTEVILGDGAHLELAGLQDFDPDTIAVVNRHATLGQGASLQWALASIGAQLHRSRIDNVLAGRGSSVHQVEIGFGSGSQLFDLTSYTRHLGEDTTGDLLSKGVFTDRSRGYIKGLIEIHKTAKGTDSFLGEFGMLLARKARSVTVPSLEIDQPNVRRAAHSSSVGPIDEAQIFYLMSRGLDRDASRRAIVLGFLEPVVARIPLPEAQDRLRTLLERKWPRAAEVAQAA